MELVHGARSVMFPLCCGYGVLSSQPLHVAIEFSAFQIHVQFYPTNWLMYHTDPVRKLCSNAVCTNYTVYIWLRMTEGCCTRSTDTGIYTHQHQHSRKLDFENSNCLFDVCHNSHAGSGLQMVWKSLRSGNCGVDQYMHEVQTSWELVGSRRLVLTAS